MAGSYDHICNEDGSFRVDLIEKMGDAHEALEECHEIIRRLREVGNQLGDVIVNHGMADSEGEKAADDVLGLWGAALAATEKRGG